MSTIAIVTFDDMESADEVLKALESLQKDKLVDLSDAVTVIKDEAGELKVSETTDFTTGRGALTGGAIGAVIGIVVGGPIVGLLLGAGAGALLARKVDLGISSDKIEAVAESMGNSSSAIFLEIESIKQEGVIKALMRDHNGTVYEVDLSDEHHAAIDDALTGTDARA
jgi:uncharacterized membrane protein